MCTVRLVISRVVCDTVRLSIIIIMFITITNVRPGFLGAGHRLQRCGCASLRTLCGMVGHAAVRRSEEDVLFCLVVLSVLRWV